MAATSPHRLIRACRAVHHGGLIAYPTESVFGLGCDPYNAAAVARLLQLKRRPVAKGLIVLASRFEQLEPLLAPLPAEMEASILASWPGPVTWVLPVHAKTPLLLTGGRSTLAVRLTAHPLAAALCDTCGPLVSTSANRSGGRPARTALQARLRLGTDVDLVVAGAVGDSPNPTEIRDGCTGEVLRAG